MPGRGGQMWHEQQVYGITGEHSHQGVDEIGHFDKPVTGEQWQWLVVTDRRDGCPIKMAPCAHLTPAKNRLTTQLDTDLLLGETTGPAPANIAF